MNNQTGCFIHLIPFTFKFFPEFLLFEKHSTSFLQKLLLILRFYKIHIYCRFYWKQDYNLYKGGRVNSILQSYNRIRLPLSAINRVNIKSLIQNRTITRDFSFHKRHILNLPLYYSIPFLFSMLSFYLFDLFYTHMVETYTWTKF